LRRKGTQKTDWGGITAKQHLEQTELQAGLSEFAVYKQRILASNRERFGILVPANALVRQEQWIDLSWLKQGIGEDFAGTLVELLKSANRKRGWAGSSLLSSAKNNLKIIHQFLSINAITSLSQIDFDTMNQFYHWIDEKYNGSSSCLNASNLLRIMLAECPKQLKSLLSVDSRNRRFPRSFSHWSTFKALEPYSYLQQLAITAACKSDYELIRKGEWTYSSAEALVVCLLLIALQTGRELSSILALTAYSLFQDEQSGEWKLRYEKGRAHLVNEQTIIPENEETSEQVKGFVTAVINRLKEQTQPLRDSLPADHPDKLALFIFIHKGTLRRLDCYTYGGYVSQWQRRHGFSDTSPTCSNETIRERFGIDQCFTIDSRRLRKSYGNRLQAREKQTGKTGILNIGLGNNPRVAENHYRSGMNEEEQIAISKMMQERQQNIESGKIFNYLKKMRDPIPVKTKMADGTAVVSEENEADARCKAPSNAFRTMVSRCRSPYFGEKSSHNGVDPCRSGAQCFSCGSQRITEDTLWETFSFYWVCILKKDYMERDIWEKEFGSVIERCASLESHPNLNVDAVAFWREEAKVNPHPSWAYHFLQPSILNKIGDQDGD